MHGKKAFTLEMLSEPEPVALISATHDVLAEELGSLGRSIPDEMARALDENIFLFSGFKTYHELNDASRLLKDEDGGFKPFDRFLQDVQAIDAQYNQNWLYAEYNFATSSTQMAAKWADIERDGDEYDLQYRTALDGLVREEHAALEGITLPPSDKFWNEYYPPNGWNCRCTAVQVLKDRYPLSDSDKACEAGERATTQIGKNGQNKAAMFRFNPGKAGKVFPPKHPYYKAPADAKKKVNAIVATVITETGKNPQKVVRDSAVQWGHDNLVGKYTFTHPDFGGKTAKFTDNSITHNLTVGGELLEAKIDVLKHLKSYLTKDLKFDYTDEITHGTNRGFYMARTEYAGKLEKFKGKQIELQFAVKSNGELEFYFIKFL